jgi:hypothetical protein
VKIRVLIIASAVDLYGRMPAGPIAVDVAREGEAP